MADILAELAKHGVVPTAISRELTDYAISKSGVRPSSAVTYDSHEVLLALPKLVVPGASWNEFYEVDYSDGPWATLYVQPTALRDHRKRFPVIKETKYAERDGHVTMEVPLDGQVPIEELCRFVDDSYDIVIAKLSEGDRLLLYFGDEPLEDEQLLHRLVDHFGLQEQKEDICSLVRPALEFVTTQVIDEKVRTAASKLGGHPDLPDGTKWPRYGDGRPLAFLGQLNLADVNKAGSPFPNLPKSGLLSIFSVWGWVKEDDSDPEVPREAGSDGSQPGWSTIIHSPKRLKLQRTSPPDEVRCFSPASVKLRTMLSLPSVIEEPRVRTLGWTEEVSEKYIDLEMSFREVRSSSRFRVDDQFTARHQLGGYATFQQAYPALVDRLGLAMLLQVGCDSATDMEWGDDGNLIFYCNRDALEGGKIEHIWGDCQSG